VFLWFIPITLAFLIIIFSPNFWLMLSLLVFCLSLVYGQESYIICEVDLLDEGEQCPSYPS